MRLARLFILSLLTLLVTVGAAVAANNNFTAHGTGDQEVRTPAVDTKAQSQAIFKLSDDGATLHYKLIVSNLDGIRVAHIHFGAAGTNGPIVAFLLPLQSPSTGTVHGVLAEGAITAVDLRGPLAGKPLSELVAALESGNAYTNIHTDAYPAGEVRGQIK
jgi:hypothetical protein